jgi:dTDP-4-dehydrorhamnose reductase
VDRAESDEAIAFAVNRDGPTYLAKACAAGGITLVHVSTDYVFDGAKQSAYTEEDPVAPLGVYGASKLAGEEAIRRLCPRHIILRTAWVYGIRGQNFVKTMLRIARESDTVRVVDDQRGCPTLAGDLADAILELAVRLRDGRVADKGLGTFHCVNQRVVTWHGFARKIFEIAAPVLERKPTVEAITTPEYRTPARRPANLVLDCSRLSRVHGLTPRSWEVALAEMLGAVMAREDKAANLEGVRR